MQKSTLKLQIELTPTLMKYVFLIVTLFSLSLTSTAQEIAFGEQTKDDYQFQRKTIDSTANAVITREFGTARIQLNDYDGRLMLIFKYHVRIKIYNKEGFKYADVVIPLHKSGDREEVAKEIVATTYNMENGYLISTSMDKKAIFNENRSKYLSLAKFTLPNVKEGSLIEYSYTTESPFLFNFKTWEFQDEIPKVASEYVAYIPANYNYNVLLRGAQKLADQKSELNKECLRINGVNIDCSKMTYTMKNVPAFLTESYMTAESNFKSAMYFELSDEQLLSGGKKAYTKSWNDVDYELMNDKTFGGLIKRKDAFKETMPIVLKNTTDNLSKAKAVYAYLKKQLRWNNFYGFSSEDGNIKRILENRTGSAAEINLTLVAALTAANLDAEAVMVSTRENGIINKLYPVITEFNYVIAKVNVDGQTYLLDATEPLLPFGLLPLRCINDQGRAIPLKKPSYWIDLKASQKNVTNYLLTGKLTEEGKIIGTLNISTIGYAAFDKRKELKKYSTQEEYVEKLDERMPKISIGKHEFLNLDSLEAPLIETYEIEFGADDPLKDKIQYSINPFIVSKVTKNPFNLNERTYPVDLGAAMDERITIKLTFPSGYTLAEKPKDLSIALPQTGGKYLLRSITEDQTFSISQVLQLNKAIYQAEDYLYLKEFYNQIIQSQKADVVLKKVN
jgi:hypothetical protein